MIDLFLVFVDRNFFIQHSFSIDFCITTRTCVEHSKLSRRQAAPPIFGDDFWKKRSGLSVVFTSANLYEDGGVGGVGEGRYCLPTPPTVFKPHSTTCAPILLTPSWKMLFLISDYSFISF